MFNDIYSYVPEEWRSYISRTDIERIIDYLNKHDSMDVLPAKSQIFEAFNYIIPDNVRVMILGPPYPRRELSSGIAYSIPFEYRFTSIAKRIPEPPLQKKVIDYIYSFLDCNRDNTLKEAINRGILLLNYPLTCTVRRKYAHIACGWDIIIKRIIERLLYREDSRLLLIAWNEEAFKIYTEIIRDWFPDIDGSKYITPSHKGVYMLVASNPDKNVQMNNNRSKYDILSSRFEFDNDTHRRFIERVLL